MPVDPAMDMSQYALLFGSCRTPGPTRDNMLYGVEQKPSRSTHAVVMRNAHVGFCFSHLYKNIQSQIYELPLYDESNRPLSIEHLETMLTSIISETETPNKHPLGICTSLDRSSWARTYAHIKGSACNV
jgi:hypothetical protein